MLASPFGRNGSLRTLLARPGLLAQSTRWLAAVFLGPWPASAASPTAPLGGSCATAGDCGFNTVCRDRTCRCPPGWDACGTGRCHYLRASHHHCGACGTACAADHQCFNGVCL
jgi:hypothetical protein